MNTYKVSELIVLHLDAGKDRNGNPRRCFVLTHALDGFLDATDEGYEGERAVLAFAGMCPGECVREAVTRELMARITTAIDTSPSAYRHFISKRMTATIRYRIEL